MTTGWHLPHCIRLRVIRTNASGADKELDDFYALLTITPIIPLNKEKRLLHHEDCDINQCSLSKAGTQECVLISKGRNWMSVVVVKHVQCCNYIKHFCFNRWRVKNYSESCEVRIILKRFHHFWQPAKAA